MPLSSMPLMPAGVCGDPWQSLTDPTYATFFANQVMTPSATFTPGQRVRFAWQLTANHGGFFAFKICPRKTGLDQACFDANPLFR